MIKAKLRLTELGCFVGSTVPYGYIKKDHRLLIDPEKVETVRRIFTDAADGSSYQAIAETLKLEGILSPPTSITGWSAGIITRIIQNVIYRGILRYSTAEAYCEELRIVSNEEWEKAQQKLYYVRRGFTRIS